MNDATRRRVQSEQHATAFSSALLVYSVNAKRKIVQYGARNVLPVTGQHYGRI